eukprot:gene10183-11864_t
MSSTVEQQIVLHQFTPRHSVQARLMLGWSREDLAREADVEVDALQRFESHGDVDDAVRLSVAFRLEAEGLVFFPGFAPGWGMNVRGSLPLSSEHSVLETVDSWKPLLWVGGSKKDLQQMPGPVQDVFGFALHLAQGGGKHSQTKALKGFGGNAVLEVVEDFDSNTYRGVYTVRFDSAVYVLHCFQKKRRRIMHKHHNAIEIEESTGNVYEDIGQPDASEMQVKAQLATKIGEILKARSLTQAQASVILGLSQPKVSEMLRGRFRGISEAKMLECLSRLGRDVQIVITAAPASRTQGRIEVLFA